ncbi:hypothetical protein EHQ92_10155 [Leptospira biflexa]|jgi:hypothetical protein|uniref:hypothetical protein n=1 Tax=Leptospira biflexa TaxID=172 RepID=UPI001090ECA2|nr:hypothetical protein [Leptospira biflexa]TGM48226.1 hypothetical protein EHQ92_10155 [Leptospira biflexa]TGM49308.1 hypothetical protein EHQ88_02925 [Leptospira biflexa]TGM54576.1 hypothetical protein EHQ91_06275 [Leptospira biflexa]
MNGNLENCFGFALTIGIPDLNSIVSNHSITIAKYSLFLNLLIYFMMNGAQIFETFVFIPRWASGNEPNLGILNTEFKSADLKYFWILFHSIHEIIFLVSLFFCYQIEGIGNYLCFLFILHMLVRAWTIIYFANKIIWFQSLASSIKKNSPKVINEIRKWIFWNYFRVSIYLGISICMIPLAIRILKVNG